MEGKKTEADETKCKNHNLNKIKFLKNQHSNEETSQVCITDKVRTKRQTDRQTNRQKGRQEKKNDRQTDRGGGSNNNINNEEL